MARIDYGLDAPRIVQRFIWRGLLLLAFAAFVYFANRDTNPGAAAPLAAALALIGVIFTVIAGIMVLSSRVVKPKIIERILHSIPWQGDEKVLDVGCGRGSFLIAAAKRLKTGKATGTDIWRAEDLSGNTADAAMNNANAEGVASRIKIETADARQLPFAANSFDVVVSSLAIHNIPSRQERGKAIQEMARVLKPGGYLAVLDVLYTGEYARAFEQLGFTHVRLSPMTFLWCVPTRSLTARKT